MSFELSVNLEYMFLETGDRLEDRMAAAAAAGFTKVEIFTTGNRDVPSLKKALEDTARRSRFNCSSLPRSAFRCWTHRNREETPVPLA